MGRPLFSSSCQPAVRVQPEPQHPTYEKWTYANAFDPDADEFFENDDAVYEAFIDPGQQIQLPVSTIRPPPTVIDAGAVSSASTSEASSSGRSSPMQGVDIDDRAARVDELRFLDDTRMPVPTPRNPTLDAQIDAGRGLPAQQRVLYYLSLIERMEAERQREHEGEVRQARPNVRDRVPTYIDLPPEDSRASTPEPVSRVPTTPSRPSTLATQSPSPLVSPSLPPSVTPRLYSWTTFPTATVPPPASPLANHSARVSAARIPTSSLVAAHRAA
ncbi:hypothetical protein BD414DRAFT_488517 [Trametes punicea]|nr:hypothetical protein BD414DRAFT_488517 [Trametes punicea]